MFYYAEIDSEYCVINTHSLPEASLNENYVAITEEQYTSGELVGKYYNSFYGRFEIVDWMNYIGNSDFVTHYDTQMLLSTKIDNMQVEINSKADADHTHEDSGNSVSLPEVTIEDNGKVLMVVNGQWQAVTLNLSVDSNGVVSV